MITINSIETDKDGFVNVSYGNDGQGLQFNSQAHFDAWIAERAGVDAHAEVALAVKGNRDAGRTDKDIAGKVFEVTSAATEKTP